MTDSHCTELAYQLKDSQSKLLFTSSATVRVAEQAAALAGIPRDHIMLFCDPDSDLSIADTLGIKPWTSIWSSPIESTTWAWKKITTPEEAGSTTAIINYSSGWVQAFLWIFKVFDAENPSL